MHQLKLALQSVRIKAIVSSIKVDSKSIVLIIFCKNLMYNELGP
jgi:hypothetical protein